MIPMGLLFRISVRTNNFISKRGAGTRFVVMFIFMPLPGCRRSKRMSGWHSDCPKFYHKRTFDNPNKTSANYYLYFSTLLRRTEMFG